MPEDAVVGIEVVEVGQYFEGLLRVDHEHCLLVKSLENEAFDKVAAQSVFVVLIVFSHLDLQELGIDVLVDCVDGN